MKFHTCMSFSVNKPNLKLRHKQKKMAALVGGDSRDFCMGDHWTKYLNGHISAKNDIEL